MKFLTIIASILFAASLSFAHCGGCGTEDAASTKGVKAERSCNHSKKGDHKCDKKKCDKKKKKSHDHGHDH